MKYCYKAHSFFKHVILGIWGIVMPQYLYSQNSLDSVQHLQEVVISNTSFSDVIPAQTLSGVELQNLNSHSIADALRFFSGVQLKDYGGIGGLKTINIRSMGTHHVGVSYDGIALGNAQNGIIDLGMYSLDNVGEIAIYNGQRSEIFQTARDFGSAGALYIYSKKPTFEDGKTSNMKLSMKAGSFDLINPSILIENKLSESVKSSFNAEWVNSSGKYKFRYRRKNPDETIAYDTTAVRENGDINATRLEGNLYGFTDAGTWQFKAYNYSSERGIPGAIVNNVWRRGERQKDMNTFIQGSFKTIEFGGFKYMLNAKYAYYRTNYMNYNTEIDGDGNLIVRNPIINDLYRQKEAYVSSSFFYSIIPGWDVSLAYDYIWNRLDSDRSDFIGPALRHTNMISLASSAQIGRVKILGSMLANYVNDKLDNANNPPSKQVYTPAVYVSYKPFGGHDFSLRAFYKKSFRMPTFNDLYYADMGNASLKPENITQYNVGFTYEKKRKAFLSLFNVKVDAYYNDGRNKIISYPKGQQFRWTMLNLGKVKIRGVEASVIGQVNPTEDLFITGRAVYTFERAIDVTKSSDRYYRDQIPYIPRNSGSFVTQATYKGWGLNYSFIYTGERYNQQENIPYNFTQPWYTHDVSVVKNFVVSKVKFRASVEVNNLLSQDYDVILNFPMPKRNYKFLLSAEF